MGPFSLPDDAWLAGMAGWIVVGCAALWGTLTLRRRGRGRPRLHRLATAGLGLWFALASLTCVEIGFALFCDRTDSFQQSNVARRWYARHVRTNAEGYRDEHPLQRPLPAGAKRVVFVGDSFTFGHGVEVHERFSDRVAAALESKSPGRTVVSNASLPGMDARKLVDALVPDVLAANSKTDVLVYTFVPNDIEYFDERTAAFYQSLAASEPRWFPFRGTYFFNWLYYRIQQLTRPAARGYYDYLAQSYEGAPWNRMEAKLDELVDLCRSRRVELRIVAYPFVQKLGPQYAFAEAHQKLATWCEARKIPFIDLRHPLEDDLGQHGGTFVVNASDAHPNARCHAVAATALLATWDW